MPGAYAHITLVNLLKEPARLEAIPGFPSDAISAVLDYFKFCELGAVSPDYPYLAIQDKKAAEWADTMHYTRTGAVVQAGIRNLIGMSGEPKRKCLAWLLGYSAHVATDVSIHPVVFLKVGPYDQNKKAHRVCELHQDAYIFQRMNLGGIGLSEHLNSGIGACNGSTGKNMDPDISGFWKDLLQEVHEPAFKKNPPDPDKWHSSFKFMVDKIAEEGNKLAPIARHVAVNCGLTYPNPGEIDRQFIDNLEVPGNKRQGYDAIFDSAIKNVGEVWRLVATGALGGNKDYVTRLGSWNLDTGRDEKEQLVFWS